MMHFPWVYSKFCQFWNLSLGLEIHAKGRGEGFHLHSHRKNLAIDFMKSKSSCDSVFWITKGKFFSFFSPLLFVVVVVVFTITFVLINHIKKNFIKHRQRVLHDVTFQNKCYIFSVFVLQKSCLASFVIFFLFNIAYAASICEQNVSETTSNLLEFMLYSCFPLPPPNPLLLLTL